MVIFKFYWYSICFKLKFLALILSYCDLIKFLMIKCRGIPKQRKNRAFCSTKSHLRKFCNTKYQMRKFCNTSNSLAKIFARAANNFTTRFYLAKPMWNANGLLYEIPTIRRKAKGHLKILFKDLQSLWLFCTIHSLLWKAQCYVVK